MTPSHPPKRTIYRPLLLAFGAVALLIGGVMFTLPRLGVAEDLSTLLIVMAVIGVASIVGGYVAYRLRLARWLHSLRWALLATLALTVALIFLNVWVTAHLMFISEYDLMVTALLLVFAGGIALIFGFFVFGAITESIRELARAAEQIAQGKLETRLDVRGNDELAEFGETFNWMAQSLQEVDEQKRKLDQQRRDLIAWASHDLRTPITSMRAMIEAMIDGVVSDPQTTNRYLAQHGSGNSAHEQVDRQPARTGAARRRAHQPELSDGIAARPDLGHARQHEYPRAAAADRPDR